MIDLAREVLLWILFISCWGWVAATGGIAFALVGLWCWGSWTKELIVPW